MEKYRLVREELIAQNILGAQQIERASEASDEDILRAHSEPYYLGLKNGTLSEKELRPIGLTWSKQLFHRSRGAVGGFLLATYDF